ncbi:AAA family ATPase [Demequina sp. TTPB684]|uniref:ABC transporter ATP-binding protein/permease n=1 Tax=unclassified Demequina TaxID=2620311 RepID=UPI001CF5ECE7|nr:MULTISPECIES: ABC transporter transmembrane domain-containing protein [unclassified Demequina]MCB2412028.1 AAA family ATPase [Demequina sp. TTPB684]UPU88841.1 ABC transporter transmembrane domain-containing protein [Demequina sp. TMPB413]
MKPIDPRLIARIGPARRYVIVTAALGFLTALTILFQALLVSRMLAPVLAPAPLTEDGLGPLGSLVPLGARVLETGLPLLVLVVVVRVALVWVQERLAHRAGTKVVSQLREAVVAHAARMGPRWIASGKGAEVVTTVTRGLDGLLPYFVRYVPQLMLASTVTPLMLVVVLGLDWLSALIVALTLPLVPLFMILVGLLTRERSRSHLEAMERLGARTLDLIAGVPTLRALGRERGPAARVRELGTASKNATMGSLRIAFLSGFVLELLTTLSVAIVAVTLGFRLIDGNVSIETALAVLILAPEVYLPVRNVGTHFHASADGMAAADAAFAILEQPTPVVGTPGGAVMDFTGATLLFDDVSVATPDGTRNAPARLTMRALPGQMTVLRGPNGEGKSTALLALAGLLSPDGGSVTATVAGRAAALADSDPDAWTSQCAWVPQRPELGPAGRELSLGQRQLAAYERALTSGRPVLLFDEPTAHLDGEARAGLVRRIAALARDGATVVVATHDPLVIEAADAVVEVRAAVVGIAP